MRKNLAPLMTSKRGDHGTPMGLFTELDVEFDFYRDVAASDDNALCKRYFTEKDNALVCTWGNWGNAVWCNPPYGRGVGAWLDKAQVEASHGVVTVMLLPARTCTKWFHKHKDHCEVRFIKGRLKFTGNDHAAPFPSMLMIFRPKRGYE